MKHEQCGTLAALEALREPGQNSPARTKLRREDAKPGAAADLVNLVKRVNDIEPEFHPFQEPGVDWLDNAEVYLLVAGQCRPIRGSPRLRGPQTAAEGQIGGEQGIGRRNFILDPGR